jgi:hypothetical protein
VVHAHAGVNQKLLRQHREACLAVDPARQDLEFA